MNHHSKLCQLLDQLSGWQLKTEQHQIIFDLESKLTGLELAAQLKDKQIKELNRNIATSAQLIQSQAAQIARLTQAVTNMAEHIKQMQQQVNARSNAFDQLADQFVTLKQALADEMARSQQREQAQCCEPDLTEAIAQLRAEVEALKQTPAPTVPRRATPRRAATTKKTAKSA